MNEQSYKKFLPVVIAVVITAVVVGGSMYCWQFLQTADNCTQVIKYNCEQSGGIYSDGICTCSEDEYEKYEESTGYCITAIGIPGGELQEQAAKLQELVMLKNTIVRHNCEKSGGTFSENICSCPMEQGEKLTYDTNTGYCTPDLAGGGEV